MYSIPSTLLPVHSTENYSRLIVLMKQPVSIVVQCSYICTIFCSHTKSVYRHKWRVQNQPTETSSYLHVVDQTAHPGSYTDTIMLW